MPPSGGGDRPGPGGGWCPGGAGWCGLFSGPLWQVCDSGSANDEGHLLSSVGFGCLMDEPCLQTVGSFDGKGRPRKMALA